MARHDVVGWRCAVCATDVALTDPAPWRCPRSTNSDRHHVLRPISIPAGDSRTGASDLGFDEPNPFVRYDRRLAWSAIAAAKGMTPAARTALIRELDAAVRDVDGVGFVTTPFARSDGLSDALGFAPGGGVWVKDETGAVAGSQKARHLFTILLHLRAMELLGEFGHRPRLAIASCGNAALAAATLARAADWPIDVFVPTWMSDGFGDRLDALGAVTHRCERRSDDPPGDPAMLRFRAAVGAGSVPFTVQGPENGLCLDGGRTIGWEIADQVVGQIPENVAGNVAGPADERGDAGGSGHLDAVVVQVGGGAFASCLGAGLIESGCSARVVAVQAEGCAPLVRAWSRAAERMAPAAFSGAVPVDEWEHLMTPWDDPHSLADGILDDETYDWIGVFEAMAATGGRPVVAREATIAEAHRLAQSAGFDASPTGTAGLAGLIEVQRGAHDGSMPFDSDARVAVVMSGVTR